MYTCLVQCLVQNWHFLTILGPSQSWFYLVEQNSPVKLFSERIISSERRGCKRPDINYGHLSGLFKILNTMTALDVPRNVFCSPLHLMVLLRIMLASKCPLYTGNKVNVALKSETIILNRILI